MAKNIQLAAKGLYTDLNEEFQPDNTYRFLLNGNFESLSGERGGVISERGNRPIIGLPTDVSNYTIIGDCLLPNQDKVIFLTNDVIQIIALHKRNNTYKELIRTECLEYERCDQIDCIFKVHNGCDNILYFTDHRTRYKSINITAVENNTGRYQIGTSHTPYRVALPGELEANIPTVEPPDSTGVGIYGWSCDLFFLSLTSNHPRMYLHKVGSNGNLRTGTYTFFIRLLDIDLNPTDWLVWTNPITIKQGAFLYNSPPDNHDGVYIPDANTEKIINKSISLVLEDLDTAFQYYEIGVVERTINLNAINRSYRLGQRLISGTNDIFLFNNVNDSRVINVDLDSLLTKTRKIDVVQAHGQINNRLVLANVKGSVRDWSKFQQISNNIKVEYFTYNIIQIVDDCDTKVHFVSSGPEALEYEKTIALLTPDAIGVNYNSPEFLSYGMSLMRDEVYALGIIYVFNDGSESPVFHIPGRPKFSTVVDDDSVITYPVGPAGQVFDYAEYAQLIESVSADPLTRLTPGPPFDILTGATRMPGLGLFDGQLLSIGSDGQGVPHNIHGSYESSRLTNLNQNNDDPFNIGLDEYKYLFGFQDHITCCYNVPFTRNACNDDGLERWQYYNTAIRRKLTDGPGAWASEDASPNSPGHIPSLGGSNPTYSFRGGFLGVPGYFNTGIEYPNITDCDDIRIFPLGPVRHHRMPDHRIEQLFDQQGDLRLSDVPKTPPADYTDFPAWLGQSNMLTVGGGNIPVAADPWQMNNAEGALKLYPLGLNLSNVAPPEEFRGEVAGYYIVRSDRTGNKTVVDKGFMNVCDTSVGMQDWTGPGVGSFPNGQKEVVDDFSRLVQFAADGSGDLVAANKIYTNDFFLTPTHKPGTGFLDKPGLPPGSGGGWQGRKLPTDTWWNILEVHTPKSTFNDPVVLAIDYIKLESTVFGDMFFDSEHKSIVGPITDPAESYIEHYDSALVYSGGIGPVLQYHQLGWNTGASVFLNRHKYPRVQSPITGERWSFIYNLPISGGAYLGYNTTVNTGELGQGATEINNSSYQQRVLVLRYGQSCKSVEPTTLTDINAVLTTAADYSPGNTMRAVCDMNMPYGYHMLKIDIGRDGNLSNFAAFSRVKSLDAFMNAELRAPYAATLKYYAMFADLYPAPGSDAWSHISNVTTTHKWSVPNSPYMYYIALKSAITPYEDFDAISYIKMHSYIIPIDPTPNAEQAFAVTGGDTFINRFQFEKGFWRINYDEPSTQDDFAWQDQGDGAFDIYLQGGTVIPNDDSIGDPQNNVIPKFATSLTVGYVESEINSAFRHVQEGDRFRSFPYNTRNSYYNYLYQANLGPGGDDRDLLDNYMSPQQISYRYKIDYSSINAEILSFALGSTYDYCSNCAESFPNTLLYSEISFDDQVEDFYKIFLTNSVRNIPNSTGEITNLFVKNSDLYIHTEHNLWKISVAPQEMQTTGATISVGQSGFLEREPIKIFNNDDAFSGGGCIDKFSAIFVDGQFIWLDRNSGNVFSLTNEPKNLSDIGLSRYFAQHSSSMIDTQFLSLTGLPYPLVCTTCEHSVGFKAVHDPDHGRYILTKKDYKILPDIMSLFVKLTIDPGDIDEYLPLVLSGTYYYDNDGVYFATADGTTNQVANKFNLMHRLDFTDPTIAENHSWTLSFSTMLNSWIGFHSYIPNWTYNDSYTYYSYINNTAPVDPVVYPILPDPPEGQPQGANMDQFSWEHNHGPFQNYYSIKQDFIIDYVYKKQPYTDKSFDTVEYTSNVWLEEVIDDRWIEIPFVTFDKFYVYNNTQISNQKTINVSNLDPYASINYDVGEATAHKWRSVWRINRLRDMSIGRLGLIDPKFTEDWSRPGYQGEFFNGYGYIDKIINPDIIDLTKDVYQIERFTEKFLNVRLFFKPLEDYKITMKILTGEKRDRL